MVVASVLVVVASMLVLPLLLPGVRPWISNIIFHRSSHGPKPNLSPTLTITVTDADDTTPSGPPPVDTSAVPALPETLHLTYLAEGAANVIYRFSTPAGVPLPDEFTNKLLRLRKALPSAQSNLLGYSHLKHTFHPLFPTNLLVPTTLIRIPPSVIARENANLQSLESSGRRPTKRHSLYLQETEGYGFVIQDMSPRTTTTVDSHQTRQVLVEFKPKWVVQSPSAPENWQRCRTCALRLSKSIAKPSLCPLDLSSRLEERVRASLPFILPPCAPKNFALRESEDWQSARRVIGDAVAGFLVSSELMPLLKRLQSELDPLGPLAVFGHGSRAEKEKFVTAMTVRDLTIFLRVDLDGGVEARIGDLDLKTGEGGKWEYWCAVEKGLVEGGWYLGVEEGAEAKGVWCRP